MKNVTKEKIKKFFSFKIILSILCVLVIISFGLCILLSYLIYGELEWDKIFFEIIKIGFSTLIITVPLGIFAKITTDKLFAVDVDMRKMRKLGIDGIGTGLLTLKDEELMFGTQKAKKYPINLKLMFLTGKAFLNKYKDQIVECMNNGCKVQLLLASSNEKNWDYLRRDAEIHRKGESNVNYVEEIVNQSLEYVKYIREKSLNPTNINVRFYIDEFQNNLRIAKYLSENNETSYYWINLQPYSKCAKELSIALKGKITNDFGHILSNTESENNVCLASEVGFDDLWNKYYYTEQ